MASNKVCSIAFRRALQEKLGYTVDDIEKLRKEYFDTVREVQAQYNKYKASDAYDEANIPIVAIRKEHQGKGLSKHMLKKSVEKLIEITDNGLKPISEVNTTTETNNFQALKMYRHLGFKEDYNYPQSYLPVKD